MAVNKTLSIGRSFIKIIILLLTFNCATGPLPFLLKNIYKIIIKE